MIGRGLRPSPETGKANLLVLDHAGAVFQHGFIHDPMTWTLEEDRRVENKAHTARGKRNAPGLTTCPECRAVRFEGKPCPVCGWRSVAKPRYVDVEDGLLGEVKSNGDVEEPILDKYGFYRQLTAILCEKRQRNPAIKDGWAAAKFKERTGTWPPRSWRGASPLSPTAAVRAWVRSRDIAYARAREDRR